MPQEPTELEAEPPVSDIPASFKTNSLLNYAHKIANGRTGERYLYCLEEDKFYIYEKGVWRQIFEIELLAKVSKSMPEITRFPLPARKQILDNFKVIQFKPLQDLNWSALLTLNNEMIDPYNGMIFEHDWIYYSTIKLKYNYNVEANCELWEKTLNEIFEGDGLKIEVLQEFFGYCLVPDVEQKKALLLLGDSDTGKSTILFTLRDLIGQQNCSSVPLKYLSNAQYTPMMVNKLVNIDADVDKNAANYEAEFKMITSGEPINCNQKFIETFSFIPKCKIVLAANIFPKITDHSSAFYKRLILIPCDRVFEEGEKNRRLNLQLKDELPGILNWAIKGLQRLKARGRFEQHDFMKDAVQELEDENNPSNLFFDEHIKIIMGSEIEKGDLFNKYVQWCINTKNFTLSKARFALCVFKKYHQNTPKDTKNPITGKRVWKNLKYVDQKGIEVTGWENHHSDGKE